MNNGNGNEHGDRNGLQLAPKQATQQASGDNGLHPAWTRFIRYCQQLGHGDIECLKIQDGLPMMAEATTKKVSFIS